MQSFVQFFLDNDRNAVNSNGKDVKVQKCEFKMSKHDFPKTRLSLRCFLAR